MPERPTQLALPTLDGFTPRTLKTSLGGTITDPLEQPARALMLYENVIGVFGGVVSHVGGEATYIDDEQAPVRNQRITLASALVPLSEDTKRDLRSLVARIVEENHVAARRIGLVDEAAEPKAS